MKFNRSPWTKIEKVVLLIQYWNTKKKFQEDKVCFGSWKLVLKTKYSHFMTAYNQKVKKDLWIRSWRFKIYRISPVSVWNSTTVITLINSNIEFTFYLLIWTKQNKNVSKMYLDGTDNLFFLFYSVSNFFSKS